jgi:general secretion pathway protein I
MAVACSATCEPARGFTLIEVLVALAILAVLATTLVSQSGNFSAQLFRLEDKTVALWVAQNALDEARLEEHPTEAGKPVEVEMAGRTWLVSRSIKPTERPGFSRIEVSVTREGDEDRLLSLSGFRAETR